jgi:hypothetical protein
MKYLDPDKYFIYSKAAGREVEVDMDANNPICTAAYMLMTGEVFAADIGNPAEIINNFKIILGASDGNAFLLKEARFLDKGGNQLKDYSEYHFADVAEEITDGKITKSEAKILLEKTLQIPQDSDNRFYGLNKCKSMPFFRGLGKIPASVSLVKVLPSWAKAILNSEITIVGSKLFELKVYVSALQYFIDGGTTEQPDELPYRPLEYYYTDEAKRFKGRYSLVNCIEQAGMVCRHQGK